MIIEKLKTDKAIRLDFLHEKARAQKPILHYLNCAKRILGVAIAISLLTSGLLWAWRIKTRSDTRGLERKAASLSGLSEAYALVQETRALEQNLSMSSGVLKERSFWAGKLGAITKAIPDGVWLASLSIGSGKDSETVSLSGGARSNRHVVLLLQSLEGLPWIQKVTLTNSHEEQITIGNLPATYVGFDIKAEARVR